jgi:TctA family transporter
MLSGAKVLAGSGWLGLKDRQAYVTRGVTLTPMFTGLFALAALLFLIGMAWWREGR